MNKKLITSTQWLEIGSRQPEDSSTQTTFSPVQKISGKIQKKTTNVLNGFPSGPKPADTEVDDH